jgi:hypothetical protein
MSIKKILVDWFIVYSHDSNNQKGLAPLIALTVIGILAFLLARAVTIQKISELPSKNSSVLSNETSQPSPTSTLGVTLTPTATASATPTAIPTAKPSVGQTVNMYVTFYGWPDNDPPGAGIAYPKVHSQAGGTGTYQDPLTFATDPKEIKPASRIYITYLKKYGIMEDLCAGCVDDWEEGKYHIDPWISSNDSFAEEVIDCEHKWTRQSTPVILNPPPDLEVSSQPLFDTSTGKCLASQSSRSKHNLD